MEVQMEESKDYKTSWLDKPIFSKFSITIETGLFILIILLAILTRFYDLESRVMSHDENTHVYYSWRLFKGEGFMHDPLMHGPLQFHMVALSYFLFGDNDLTAKLPAAIFSLFTVIFVWNYRRYLGKAGAIVAAVLMLISPYMLFYGRYVRNESYVALFGVITLWAILRFLETGKARYTYWLTAAMVLHFTSKETSFIYAAQALLFLALYLLFQVSRKTWRKPERLNFFLIAFLIGILLIGSAGASWFFNRDAAPVNSAETSVPVEPGSAESVLPAKSLNVAVVSLGILAILAFSGAGFYLIDGFSWEALKQERSFSLLILMGTLVLPQLSAFPIRFLGWNIPTNAGEVNALGMTDIWRYALVLVPMFLLSIVVGLIWNPKLWLVNAAIWYGLFTIFYTSMFTHGAGFFTGVVGSLGYWIEQQDVNRGSQPWYYYWLVQVPVYEYLPAIGSLIAVVLVFLRKGKITSQNIDNEADFESAPVVALLGFWSITSLIAFTIAGEKMPWLTVHITLPLILLAGWAIGVIIENTDWSLFKKLRGWLILAVLLFFLVSFSAAIGSLLGATPPFQGKELVQLQATTSFLISFTASLASGIGLWFLIKPWPLVEFGKFFLLTILAIMGILTFRTALQASFINYDNANELLVYAHSAGGVKVALSQIEEISRRMTDGLDIKVAYDSETSYPYYWYLRNYPNAIFFGKDPSRTLRDAPVILVGDANYTKLEPIVGQAYYPFEYIRLWWPNQDYYALTLERIWNGIRSPELREALFQIWLNRDYTKYGEVMQRDISLTNWSPSVRMRLYVRKDVASQMWNYGIGPSEQEIVADPYEGKGITLSADNIIGTSGSASGQLLRPRDLEVAPDGSIYVADTDNHRIVHFSPDGTVLHEWGTFGDITTGDAPGGTFNQPWGIAIGTDGSVFVSDLWNHRIQKFTPDGKFIRGWGIFGQGETPESFWGPRDVEVSPNGEVFVSDTGNKRIVVFNEEGEFITQFGSPGIDKGQFDEPVGVTVDANGDVYVADTWNQRIQVFTRNIEGNYEPKTEWNIAGWYGQSLDNKPYLDIDSNGHLFVTDPEGLRILEFLSTGEFIRYWGDLGSGNEGFGLAGSVAVDPLGGVWVSDTGNGRIMHFPTE